VRETAMTNPEEIGLFMAGLFDGKRACAPEPDYIEPEHK
jgi:hypothetical protein